MFRLDKLPDKDLCTVRQRNAWWHSGFLQMMIENDDLSDAIPNGSTVYLMPSVDEELCEYNRSLMDAYDDTSTVVIVQIHVDSAQSVKIRPLRPMGPPIQFSGT